MLKLRFIIISILIFLTPPFFSDNRVFSSPRRELIVFYSPTCHECAKIKNEFLPKIEEEFKDKIKIEYCNIDNTMNFMSLLSLKERYNTDLKFEWPVLFFEGKFLSGSKEIKDSLKQLIANSLGMAYKEERLPEIDLARFFKRLKVVGVIVAGLEDGINPCAFTVIVFFISYLALQGYKKKGLIIIGLSFIFAVFLTYFLIGLGLFNIIYALNKFWLASKIFNISMGTVSIILGILALYDLFKFKKTRQTEGQILQLPKILKDKIHFIIGSHYRKSKENGLGVTKPHIFRLILTALITGFLVTFLEAACTGQLYVPTISAVTRITNLRLKALSYLAIYNIMFILPLVIIFIFALLGTTSEQFSKFLKNHLLSIKALMAALFFILGIFLIWRA